MNLDLYNKANNYFNTFISNNFDINDDKIHHKLDHTYSVVNISKYIASKLNLDEINTNIAMIIALLHDIGRFDQAKEMKSFREDITSYDHATLGAKLLFEKNEIRNYIDDDKYDNIIYKAILNHSKYELDKNKFTDIELLHANIIRDADKFSGYRSKTFSDVYTMANITKEEIENSIITDKIYNDFMNEKTILSKDRKTGIDIWISYIAYLFGIEFKCTYELINEENLINKLFDRFDYKLEKARMKELKEKALNYLKMKLK